MKKSKIFGTLLALTLAAVPFTGTPLFKAPSDTIVKSITADAATPGCYRANGNISYYYFTIEYRKFATVYKRNNGGQIDAGTYLSSNGGTYTWSGETYLRIYFNGGGYYVRMSDVTFYAN